MIVARGYPFRADLEFAATSDFSSVQWIWQTSPNPPTVSGTPIDLTGYSAVAIIFANFDDSTPLLTITDAPSSDGQVLLGGVAGSIQIVLTHSTTAALQSDPLRWSLRLTSPAPASLQTVLIEGTVRRWPIGPLA